MAIAASKAEESLKEQVLQSEKEQKKERNSLMMLDEEQKRQFQIKLQQQNENENITKETMLQARLNNVDLSLENEKSEEKKD